MTLHNHHLWREKIFTLLFNLDISNSSALMCGQDCQQHFGRPSCSATEADKKQLLTIIRKQSVLLYDVTLAIWKHKWFMCSTTFQPYGSRILGQHVPYPMDRSRKIYSVVHAFTWFKFNWILSVETFKHTILCTSSQHHSSFPAATTVGISTTHHAISNMFSGS
jgi:hypothetical protein